MNLANGGECAYPFPELRPSNVGVWNLFHLAYSGTNHVGMDGVPIGRNPRDLESLARGLDLPWDQTTIEKVEIIQSAYLKKEYADRAAERARRK
jgi:hypothetical protein